MSEQPTGREFRVATEAWPTEDLDIRADGDGMTFHGYAAVFNSWSEDLGGFRERIEPGAFARSIKHDRNIRMFLNHDSGRLLATTRAKTLTLAEDDRGLRVEAALPDTTEGRDLAALLTRGDVDSMSFGFQVTKNGQRWSADGSERTLTEVRLFEVSPVTGWPAYNATSAFVRHLADEIDEEVEALEDAFRVLASRDERLTTDQRDLIVRAVNAKTDSPVIASNLADWRSRFAEMGYTV